MAFTPINSTAIQVGKPVTSDLFTTIKDNFDDHETRIAGQESGNARVVVFNFPVLNGTSSSTLTGLTYFRVPYDFTLTEARIIIYEKGSLGGEIEFDIKKNTSLDDTGMTSVFTTLPKLTLASVSDYAESSNAVFDAGEQAVVEGEFLRLDMTELPTSGIMGKWYIYLAGEI